MNRLLPRFAKSLRVCKVHPPDATSVAIALSGGPDSVALAALAARWHQDAAAGTPPPLALVVDHRLRPESRAEAEAAAAQAEALGLRPRLLTVDWGGAPPLQQHKMLAAREARYALLLDACQREGAHSLLTAHHAGDQAETFLLRLLHASGVDGLACMRPASDVHLRSHGVRLLRPLLSTHKHELHELCRTQGLPFAVDPSNDDVRYQRNRLRQLLWQGEEGEGANADSQQGNVPQVVLDALLLQRICARTSAVQQMQAAALLRRSVLQTSSGLHLPVKRAAPPATGGRNKAARPRWVVDWQARSREVSSALGPIPHAILEARPYGGAAPPITETALSRLLQDVSRRGYPPGLSDCVKLGRRLAGGRLVGAFTGGGCVVQPLPRSRGRYVLVLPQTHRALALEVLHPAKPTAAAAELGATDGEGDFETDEVAAG